MAEVIWSEPALQQLDAWFTRQKAATVDQEDTDLYGSAVLDGRACIHRLVMREGRMIGRKEYVIEDVEALVTSLGLQLESTELKLADSDIRGLAVRHVGSLLVDVPSTVFALRRSPRLLKHLQASRDGFEDDPGDAERKTHQRLLRQFRQSLLDHLRRDRALTPIRDKAFECVGVADLAERLRQPLA